VDLISPAMKNEWNWAETLNFPRKVDNPYANWSGIGKRAIGDGHTAEVVT
jgi:hypothetical protein